MSYSWNAKLLATAFKQDQFPGESLSEIAFAGRSNVGKSMLLNALTDSKLAHIGATPGKTRSVNFYKITAAKDFILVDLPGYGFAARSHQERGIWAHLIEDYILRRQTLRLLIHLVDFRHGLLPKDRELQEWTAQIDVPVLIVFTKADKIAKGRRKGLLHAYIRDGLKSIEVPFIVSAQDKTGIVELKQFLTNYLDGE